jgi:predicted RNA-binding Zn ribbon-like protein
VLDWSDTASCSSFMTYQPKKKKKLKKNRKMKWFEEIQNVLDFGEKAKQITKTKLIKNPTIENLKKSALQLREMKKRKFQLGNLFLLN